MDDEINRQRAILCSFTQKGKCYALRVNNSRLVAVDAEKLTITSRRPSHKKSRQATQSTAAFFKLSTASSGSTAASGEAMGV
jgi:hypothetical protein